MNSINKKYLTLTIIVFFTLHIAFPLVKVVKVKAEQSYGPFAFILHDKEYKDFGPYSFHWYSTKSGAHYAGTLEIINRTTGSRYQFTFGSTGTQEFGKLTTYKDLSFYVDLHTDNWSSIWVYNLTTGFEATYDLKVDVTPGDLLDLGYEGEGKTLEFKIKNTGTLEMEKVTYSLALYTGGYMLVNQESSPTSGEITPLSPGESYTLKYKLKSIVNQLTVSQLTLTLTFPKFIQKSLTIRGRTVVCLTESEGETSYTVTVKTGKPAPPKEYPRIRIDAAPPSPNKVLPGGTSKISVAFSNIGNGSAYEARIYAYSTPSDLQFTDEDETNMGSLGYSKPNTFINRETGEHVPLEPGKSVTYHFSVKAPEIIETTTTYLITIKIEYYDNQNNYLSESTNLTLLVEKPGEPAVTISKKISSSLLSIGGRTTITIEVENTGSGKAHNVRVEDSFPPQFHL